MKALKILSIALVGAGALGLAACGAKGKAKEAVNQAAEAVKEAVAAPDQDVIATETTVTGQTETDADAQALTALFQDNVGKTATDCGLLADPTMKAQLVALVGQKEYDSMVANWQTQVPVAETGGIYTVGGMKADSGANPGYTIIYNPKTKNLCVAIATTGSMRMVQQQAEQLDSTLIQFPANPFN